MTSFAQNSRDKGALNDKPDWGMWLFILLDMTTFGLFFAVFLWEMSNHRDSFNADAAHLMIPLGLINTLVLLTSSYAVVLAVHAGKARDTGSAARHLRLALGAAGLFFTIKMTEYTLEVRGGHTLTSSPFFSFYFILTGIHLLHICIGTILLSNWRNDVIRGKKVAERWMESVAAYWHMVDLLWLVIYSLVYIGSNA